MTTSLDTTAQVGAASEPKEDIRGKPASARRLVLYIPMPLPFPKSILYSSRDATWTLWRCPPENPTRSSCPRNVKPRPPAAGTPAAHQPRECTPVCHP